MDERGPQAGRGTRRPSDEASDRTGDLRLRAAATARQLPALRELLERWAEAAGLPAAVRDDMVLACYEAMANVVMHAYDGRLGVLDLSATRHRDPESVEVVVSDHGRWRPPHDGGLLHGRGLPMMRALATDTRVDAGENGTVVRMYWALDDTASHTP